MNKEIMLPNDRAVNSVPSVTGAKAVGSKVLVEILTPKEITGTALYLREDTKLKDPPQAYILGMGPLLKPDEVGFKVGDRVVLNGTFVPVPNYNKEERVKGVIEVHCVAAVLFE